MLSFWNSRSYCRRHLDINFWSIHQSLCHPEIKSTKEMFATAERIFSTTNFLSQHNWKIKYISNHILHTYFCYIVTSLYFIIIFAHNKLYQWIKILKIILVSIYMYTNDSFTNVFLISHLDNLHFAKYYFKVWQA